MPKFFDHWDVGSFDSDVLEVLREQQNVIVGYLQRERELLVTHDLISGRDKPILRPENRWWHAFEEARRSVSHVLRSKTMRGYHYTRMTDREVRDIESAGIVISTEDFMLHRLSNAVTDGHLTDSEMAEIIENSPLQYPEGASRSGKFYLTGAPQPIDDLGVKYLLNVWGGEVVNMYLEKHDELWQKLQQIGRPRIIEVAAPLAL